MRQNESSVKAIISQVKKSGDSALLELTKKFDGAEIGRQNLQIEPQEIEKAYTKVSKEQVSAIRFMKERVRLFEERLTDRGRTEILETGIKIRNVLRPIASVGCYVPGGQATYPSTLIMTVVPAKVAGVPRVVVCSPPDPLGKVNPLVLVAADICGVDEIYRVGGAQAIAALAYGTETIRPVKKIVGPGNRYVTLAKILVSTDVAIDMPAGPSEVLVLADETANPQFIVVDIISQAEHGVDSVAGLITTSEKLAGEVQGLLGKSMSSLPRAGIIETSLQKNAFILTCPNLKRAVELVNIFAPEHIEIMTRDADKIAEEITSAGLILVGPYSPVALSDYCAGTNHVLPTAGFGHAFSGLSVFDFSRRLSIVAGSKEGLSIVKDYVNTLAEAENLPNHYNAIARRLEK